MSDVGLELAADGLKKESSAGARRTGPDSWEEVYDDLGERVFRLLHRLTGNPDLAEELTQDTFVRVFEKLEGHEGRGALAAWVFRIARNLAVDRFRRPRLVSSLPPEELETAAGGFPEGRTETVMAVRGAVAGLDDGHRAVLLLHEIDGYTHDEIGEMLAIASGTSRARLSRSRSRLRKALAVEGAHGRRQDEDR